MCFSVKKVLHNLASLALCPIVARFTWCLSGSCKDILCHSKSCWHDDRFEALHVRARNSLFVSICWVGKGFSEGISFAPCSGHPPYLVATCSVTGSLNISRATPTFFSNIRSVSPNLLPKTNKTLWIT